MNSCGVSCCTHTSSDPHMGLTYLKVPAFLGTHSTSCAFSSSYGESDGEWSSFCSHVVHNSCKNMTSAVSASKGGSQACVWKETQSLIMAVARSWRQLFNLQLHKDFCFFFNLKKMKAENIRHNYLVYLCKLIFKKKGMCVMTEITSNKISTAWQIFWWFNLWWVLSCCMHSLYSMKHQKAGAKETVIG